MKIEVLYFAGCPNHEPAVALVRRTVEQAGVAAQIEQIDVQSHAQALELGFLGSPSIRIDGRDIEPAARASTDYGMMCRTYSVQGRSEGLPPRELLLAAIREAQTGQPQTTAVLAAGSVIASILASFCCILPIVFAITGFSILGASAWFDAGRPYLLGLTLAFLAAGFYFAYRPAEPHCAPGSACEMPPAKRPGRLALWLAAAAVAVAASFPYYSGWVAEFLLDR